MKGSGIMRNNNTKTYIIVGLCALLAVLSVGYAVFSTQLTINATGNIKGKFEVYITGVRASESQGFKNSEGVETPPVPSVDGTTDEITFDVNLTSPGDYVTYDITVTNSGNLDAFVDTVEKEIKLYKVEGTTETEVTSANPPILFTVENDATGADSVIAKDGGTKTIKVTVAYDSTVTSQPQYTKSTITLKLNYKQYRPAS